MAHKLKIFCETAEDGELSTELKKAYHPNEYLKADETNAVLRGATIGVKLLYDVIDCADITLGYNTAATELIGQTAAITKGLLAATNGNMATADKLGTIKVGYSDTSPDSRNYPLKVDANGNAYTTVPWSMAEGGTSDNTPDTIVRRDTDGNFSANNITANLLGNATTADKINTKVAVGNYAKPVYLSSTGVITACTESFSDYYNITMSHIECSYNGTTVTISSSEVEKLTRFGDKILFLKLNYTNSSNTKYDILKFNNCGQETNTLTYTFANSERTVEISLTGEQYDTLDEILMYGTITSKATYADYADYAIKNSNGSYSKFTHKQNGVLYVGDTHIVSKKILLWSGSVNIASSGDFNYVDIYTHTESLIGKKLEIWVYDYNGLFTGPITFNVENIAYQNIKRNYIDTNSFKSKTVTDIILELRYNTSTNKFDGLCLQRVNHLNDYTVTTSGYNCSVQEIYEIIE